MDQRGYFFRNVFSFLEDFKCVIQNSKNLCAQERAAIEYGYKVMTEYLNGLKKMDTKNRMLVRKRTSVPSKLRSLRLQRGLTLKGVAILAGLTPSYISYIEKRGVPQKRATLEKLAFALDCSVEDLAPDEYLDKGEVDKD